MLFSQITKKGKFWQSCPNDYVENIIWIFIADRAECVTIEFQLMDKMDRRKKWDAQRTLIQ